MQNVVMAAGVILGAIAIWFIVPIFAVIMGTGLAIWVLAELIGIHEDEKKKPWDD